MNQKEENRSQLVGVHPYPFQTRNSPRFCNKSFLGWDRCWNCVASILVQKSLAAKLVQKGSAAPLVFLKLKTSFNIQLEKCQKSFMGRLWKVMMILALTNAHDFSFPCKWFSFESESGRRRCPCRARVFLGPMPPVIPFKTSARCKNSDNLEFCILFPCVNVTKSAK